MRVQRAAPGSSESRISIRRAALRARLRTSSKRWRDADLSRTSRWCFKARAAPLYEAAFSRLQSAGLVYGCTCSRKDVEDVDRSAGGLARRRLPGNMRRRAQRPTSQYARTELVCPDEQLGFVDRAAGRYAQDLKDDVGDFVIRRADGLWAYQLAVVVDDAEQGITDVVRGADLLDNTPRQIFLQRALGLATPRYLHVPLVLSATGEKLSKQTGATAVDGEQPVLELQAAAQHLGLGTIEATSVDEFLTYAIDRWRAKNKGN